MFFRQDNLKVNDELIDSISAELDKEAFKRFEISETKLTYMVGKLAEIDTDFQKRKDRLGTRLNVFLSGITLTVTSNVGFFVYFFDKRYLAKCETLFYVAYGTTFATLLLIFVATIRLFMGKDHFSASSLAMIVRMAASIKRSYLISEIKRKVVMLVVNESQLNGEYRFFHNLQRFFPITFIINILLIIGMLISSEEKSKAQASQTPEIVAAVSAQIQTTIREELKKWPNKKNPKKPSR